MPSEYAGDIITPVCWTGLCLRYDQHMLFHLMFQNDYVIIWIEVCVQIAGRVTIHYISMLFSLDRSLPQFCSGPDVCTARVESLVFAKNSPHPLFTWIKSRKR